LDEGSPFGSILSVQIKQVFLSDILLLIARFNFNVNQKVWHCSIRHRDRNGLAWLFPWQIWKSGNTFVYFPLYTSSNRCT